MSIDRCYKYCDRNTDLYERLYMLEVLQYNRNALILPQPRFMILNLREATYKL